MPNANKITKESRGSNWDKLKKLKTKIKSHKKSNHEKMDSTRSDIEQNRVVGRYTPKTDIYHVQNN